MATSNEDGLRNLQNSVAWAENLVERNKELTEKMKGHRKLVLETLELKAEVKELRRLKTLKEAPTTTTTTTTTSDYEGVNYVVVLIDGDGMIFADQYLKNGMDGGSQAANALLEQVQTATRRLLPQLTSSVVQMHVFANVDGLAKALVAAKVVSTPGVARAFTHGFTQAKEMSNFIDVGAGKEMADEKVKAELRWHLESPMCRLVILGGSHDNGYARVLKFVTTHSMQADNNNKIVLLEGTPFAKEISALQRSFQSVKFPGIFRTNKLPPINYPKKPIVEAEDTPIARPTTTTTTPTTPTPVEGAAFQKIRRLNPPPCTHYYIRSKCEVQKCKHSHSYTLTMAQLEALRKMTKLEILGPPAPSKALTKEIIQKLSQVQPGPCARFFISPYGCDFPICPLSHKGAYTADEMEVMRKLDNGML